MNKIDEIALRVADEVFTGNCEDSSEILQFAHALLAELSKDAEPVAEVVWFDPELNIYPEPAGKIIDGALSFMDSAPIGTKLFTHPAPVIASEQKPVADIVSFLLGETAYNGLWFGEGEPKYWWRSHLRRLKFTTPPNTADIEQRVAEACEKLCVENHGKGDDAACCAYDIREGQWRKFQ